jgi:hypothetical protein
MCIRVCYVPGPGQVVDFAPNPNWISDLFYVKIAIRGQKFQRPALASYLPRTHFGKSKSWNWVVLF